jgi:hypothetical protein
MPVPNQEELYWRDRISQEILGDAMARDTEERIRDERSRKTHPKFSLGLEEAARIAREGL